MNKSLMTSKIRKAGLAFLSLLLASTIWLAPMSGFAAANGTVKIGNGFLDVYVDSASGRFAIATDDGNPRRDQDSGSALLFGGSQPKTSFTTFRIDGEDYIYGNAYGFMGLDSAFTQSPVSSGLANQAVWSIKGLQITQTIQLIGDGSNPNVGNVKISYEVENRSDTNVNVGSRILLDTMLGAKDAAPITLEGDNRFIQTETKLEGDLPQYWRAVDDPLAPEVISYGFLSGWDNLSPDRMIIGHWDGLAATKWTYHEDESLNFASGLNRYGRADSALALYWDDAGLAPGESRTYETYYGLGSFDSDEKEAGYSTLLTGPKALEVNADKDGYTPSEFEIHLALDNTYGGAEQLEDVTIELGLPAELRLADGEQAIRTLDSVAANETRTISWRVQALPQPTYTASRYWVSVQAMGGEEVRKAAYIILPATSGALPEVQVLDVLPNKKYVGDDQHEWMVTGKGLELLMGDSSVEVSLTRDQDGQVYTIPYESFAITSGYITVQLDEVWTQPVQAGEYTLQIDAEDKGVFEKKLVYTEDEAYRSRQYGVLAITSTGSNHTIEALESEAELDTIADEKLVVIRGDIVTSGTGANLIYEVKPGATLNGLVKFSESDLAAVLFAEEQKLTIQKQGGEITVRGMGALSIPSFPFAVGEFTMALQDGTDYAHYPDEKKGEAALEIEWPLMSWSGSEQNLNSMPVKLETAKLGDRSVSFGGKIRLHLGTAKNDDAAGEAAGGSGGTGGGGSVGGGGTGETGETGGPPSAAGITVEMQEARFGTMDNGQFGLVGINAQGEVKMPEAFIPGMTFAADGRVLINTFDKIYEVEVGVSFEVVEANGLISIRFTDDNFPVVDKLEFAIGAKPGIPLVPPTVVGYVTKAGGGFQNLYDTIMGNFQVLPPLKLVLMGDMELAKIVEASNMRLEVSLQETGFSGDFKIASVPILNGVYGNVKVADSTEKIGIDVTVGAKLSVLEFINGEVSAVFSYDSSRTGILGPIYLAGKGYVAIVIPKNFPVIGNVTLASVEAEVSTEKLYARAAVLEVPIAVSYEWGGDAHFQIGRSGEVAVLGQSSGAASGFGEMELYDPGSGDYMGVMTFGTNVRKGMSSSDWSNVRAKSHVRVLEEGSAAPTVPVPAGQDYVLFEMLMDDDGRSLSQVLAALNVTGPSGTYALAEGENVQLTRIAAADSAESKDQLRLLISAANPTEGTWTFNYDKEAVVTPYYASELPGFDEEYGIRATRSGDQVEVTWSAEHAAGMSTALYLTSDNETDAGQLMLSPDETAAETGKAVFTLPENLPSGHYYVKAVLVDGDTNVHSLYSEESIAFENANEPESPTTAAGLSIGNGFVQVDWTYDGEADGFALQALDEDGNPLAGVGAVYVDGDDRTANIGGVFTNTITDPDTGETIEEEAGLLPGHTYRFSVQAYNTVGESKVFSTATVTSPVAVAVPNPATVDLQVPEDQAKAAVDETGATIYWTAQDEVDLLIDSDQQIDAYVYRNGIQTAAGSGTAWSEAVALPEDGTYHIEVAAENAQGDMTVSAIEIRKDTAAPDLKIESPAVSQTAKDSVAVRGAAEPGSRLTINGESVALDPDGRFDVQVSLDGYMTRIITIVAEDQTGNRTGYTSEVLNESMPSIDRVEIRPESAAAAADELEATAGRGEQLTLVAVAGDGEEYVIDPANVEWGMLLGEEYGSVSAEGLLLPESEGELVVKANYAISADYALEDALIVSVVPAPVDPDPDPDPDGSDDSDDSGSGTAPAPDIDQQLKELLEEIMQAEENIELIGVAQLSAEQDNIIAIGDYAKLTLFKQEGLGGNGVAFGRVTNPERYVPEAGSLELLGDIYEIKLNQPIDFAQQPLFAVQINGHADKDTAKIKIYWFNEQKSRWEYIGGDYDADQRTVTAALPHFSKYAVLYNPDQRVFADMNGRWSEDIVYRLHSIGIVDGSMQLGQWRYEPGKPISREAFIKLLAASAALPLTDEPLPDSFADREQAGKWAVPYLQAALKQEWLQGSKRYGKLWLDASRSITRAEAAAMIARVLGEALPADASLRSDFTDRAEVPQWAAGAVDVLAEIGLISGYLDGSFRPDHTLTREEAAAMILHMLDWQYAKGEFDL